MDDRRTRIYETLWLFWAFLLVGFVNGILGPTLLDLQQMTGASMPQMTYVFFAQGVGFIAGIILACVLDRFVSSRFLLTLYVLMGCVVNLAFPWATTFYHLVVMFFVLGLAKGLVDYGVMCICNQLWQEKGAPFQFVTLGAGIASFVAPFLATPFLANGSISADSIIMGGFGNQTEEPKLCQPEEDPSKCVESRVQYAYVIIGIVCLPAAPAIAYYHRKRMAEPLLIYESFDQFGKRIYSSREFLFIVLIFLFHIPVFGILLAYGDLLTPYGVRSVLHLSKSRMAIMTSAFWGSFLAGRTINLFFSKCLSNFVLLLLNFIGLIVACILLTFVPVQEVVLWMGTAALGVFVSPYLPMVLAWSAEHVHLTGDIITASLVASGIGEVFVPFISGQCFFIYGPQCLMYFISGTVFYELVVFVLLAICARGLSVDRSLKNY